MRLSRLAIFGILLALSACRGAGELKCLEGGDYLDATTVPKVRAPEDLDNLDTLKEMPVPEPSPRPPRSPDEGCLEAPPLVIDD